MSSTDWTAIGAVATGVGSLASACTLFFIALQTKATRESANATEKSASVAADSLVLARRAHDQSERLVVEAVKARIDSQTPLIKLSADPRITWPPLVPSAYHLGVPQPHKSSEPFHFPRDEGDQLILRVYVVLSNDSDTTVEVRISQDLYKDAEDGSRTALHSPLTLPPRSTLTEVYFDVQRTVAEWAAIWETRDSGRPSAVSEFEVTYVSPFDTGVIDYHRITVEGTIITPVSDQAGTWQVLDGRPERVGVINNYGWGVPPTMRTYYLSLSREIQLGEPSLISTTDDESVSVP